MPYFCVTKICWLSGDCQFSALTRTLVLYSTLLCIIGLGRAGEFNRLRCVLLRFVSAFVVCGYVASRASRHVPVARGCRGLSWRIWSRGLGLRVCEACLRACRPSARKLSAAETSAISLLNRPTAGHEEEYGVGEYRLLKNRGEGRGELRVSRQPSTHREENSLSPTLPIYPGLAAESGAKVHLGY